MFIEIHYSSMQQDSIRALSLTTSHMIITSRWDVVVKDSEWNNLRSVKQHDKEPLAIVL
jgi:hypothetical protein